MVVGRRGNRKIIFGEKAAPEASSRRIRRMTGLVHRALSDDLLVRVTDPRDPKGRRWKQSLAFMRTVLLGLACGCKGFQEVERLTERLSKSIRKLLGIHRRMPDTTLRDFLRRLSVQDLQELLYVVGYDAWRRKALPKLVDFPFHVLSMDGKYPSFNDPGDYEYMQHRHDKETGEYLYSVIRTITATLVTAPGRPILGAVPVPESTNEMGEFQKAFGDFVRIYGELFKVVMYDAGAASDENAQAVVDANKHYFFQIADPRWIMYQMVETLFADQPILARTEEHPSSNRRVVRELSLITLRPISNDTIFWPHTRTIFKVYSETYLDDELMSSKTRYFVSSLESTELEPEGWLRLVVMRWGVETSHQILDQAFEEDARPWFRKEPQGALVMMLLRRLIYTVLTLFKARTQRSDDRRLAPWHELLEDISDAMKMATEEQVAELRSRTYQEPRALA